MDPIRLKWWNIYFNQIKAFSDSLNTRRITLTCEVEDIGYKLNSMADDIPAIFKQYNEEGVKRFTDFINLLCDIHDVIGFDIEEHDKDFAVNSEPRIALRTTSRKIHDEENEIDERYCELLEKLIIDRYGKNHELMCYVESW